jgi:hypothetical protein
VAGRAARLAVVELPTALRGLRDRLGVAGQEAIDRRVEREQRALEVRDRLADARDRRLRIAERALEERHVLRKARELLLDRRVIRHRHLDRIDDRQHGR